nr:hypothetical protein GCM10020185_26600 [Pseudomonas brassicacearum subsp. brassicacearum]
MKKTGRAESRCTEGADRSRQTGDPDEPGELRRRSDPGRHANSSAGSIDAYHPVLILRDMQKNARPLKVGRSFPRSRVGMPPGTLCVPLFGARSVPGCIPTRSVGTSVTLGYSCSSR